MILCLAISAELQARLQQLGQQLDQIDERKSATQMNIDLETDTEAKVSHVTLFTTQTNKHLNSHTNLPRKPGLFHTHSRLS